MEVVDELKCCRRDTIAVHPDDMSRPACPPLSDANRLLLEEVKLGSLPNQFHHLSVQGTFFWGGSGHSSPLSSICSQRFFLTQMPTSRQLARRRIDAGCDDLWARPGMGCHRRNPRSVCTVVSICRRAVGQLGLVRFWTQFIRLAACVCQTWSSVSPAVRMCGRRTGRTGRMNVEPAAEHHVHFRLGGRGATLF